jgi:Na+-transporting NADH:ubiquinone oxidoreductase subunit NqrF
MNLIVFGKASNNIIANIKVDEINDVNKTLMFVLLLNKITIASSCNGEGKCQKCLVNNNVLSCQISVNNFINNFGNKIEINYL